MSHYAALEVKDLNYKYPDGTAALRGIDLHIHEGEKLGIMGPNGAGKSTLLLHFNGILTGKGEVSVFGLPVRKNTIREIRQSVGMIFQNPDDQLFCPTVYDDIAFGVRQMGMDEKEVSERVSHSLQEVGLDESLLQKSSFHLSFGQKKLVSIATVLSMHARILVFDEPTIGLDPRARKQIIKLIGGLGRTQIVASHDFDFLSAVCDQVMIIYKGKTVVVGKPEKIINDIELLKKYELE